MLRRRNLGHDQAAARGADVDQRLDFEPAVEDVVVPGHADGAVVAAEPIPLSSMIMREVIGTGPDAVAHNAPRRQFIVHLEGAVEVETSDGERRRDRCPSRRR